MIVREVLTVAVILLFISVSAIPSTGTILRQSCMPTPYDGNTLYVGGDGPGNYSKIQDAIDNASDGDTVFVYDDSSPYYENVVVDKSIMLIGEDKNTTIIDGDGWGDVVSVSADFMSIKGFTIQDSGDHLLDSGVEIHSKSCSISDNILVDNFKGITLGLFSSNCVISTNILDSDDFPIFLNFSHDNIISCNKFSNYGNVALWIEHSHNNIIIDNVILSWSDGIWLSYSDNNTISGNKISTKKSDISCFKSANIFQECYFPCTFQYRMQMIDLDWILPIIEPIPMSIGLLEGSNNNISRNYLSGGNCLILVNTSHTIIFENTIIFYSGGIMHIINHNNSIIRNNFFKNLSDDVRGIGTYTFVVDFELSDDLWDGNYWGRSRLLPKPIFGIKLIKLRKYRMFPWFQFDWHPAKKPYDIEA